MNADSFNDRVYAVVRKIPRGMVATYGMIAAALDRPRDARQVGRSLYVCREADVPCHRVVNRHGVLTGAWAFDTPVAQREALASEGIAFDEFGRVNMRAHTVPPEVLEMGVARYLFTDTYRDDPRNGVDNADF